MVGSLIRKYFGIVTVSGKVTEASFDWPGNVRQLEKAIFNAVLHHEFGRDLTADEVLIAARQVNRLA